MKNLFTDLDDRVLRFDGVSIVKPEDLISFLLRGLKPNELRCSEITAEIAHFNQHVSADERVKLDSNDPVSFKFNWNTKTPVQEHEAFVESRVLDEFEKHMPKYNSTELDNAVKRIAQELDEYKARGLMSLLCTIIEVLDHFKKHDLVYGVGRGSSCASYVLFVLGLHMVDCVKFDVDLEEFFHD